VNHRVLTLQKCVLPGDTKESRRQLRHTELLQRALSSVGLARHHMIDIKHAATVARIGEASKISALGEELLC
jgi:hypothetical protein